MSVVLSSAPAAWRCTTPLVLLRNSLRACKPGLRGEAGAVCPTAFLKNRSERSGATAVGPQGPGSLAARPRARPGTSSHPPRRRSAQTLPDVLCCSAAGQSGASEGPGPRARSCRSVPAELGGTGGDLLDAFVRGVGSEPGGIVMCGSRFWGAVGARRNPGRFPRDRALPSPAAGGVGTPKCPALRPGGGEAS